MRKIPTLDAGYHPLRITKRMNESCFGGTYNVRLRKKVLFTVMIL